MHRTTTIVGFCVTASLLFMSVPSFAQETPAAQPRAYFVPTAWLVPQGTLHLSTGLNLAAAVSGEAEIFGVAATGLGDLAQFDIGITDAITVCETDCSERHAAQIPTLSLKIGLPESHWASWQPGLALGFRKSFLEVLADTGGRDDMEGAELYVVAGKRLGPFWLQLGANAYGAAVTADVPPERQVVDFPIRPMAAAGWTVGDTTVMADVSWIPQIADTPDLLAVANAGVHFRAYEWLATELGVRLRQGDDLDDTVVFARLISQFSL